MVIAFHTGSELKQCYVDIQPSAVKERIRSMAAS